MYRRSRVPPECMKVTMSCSTLYFTSCQAPNAERHAAAVVDYLGRRLGRPTAFVRDMPWLVRQRLLDRGIVHAGWICGLPYVQRADDGLATVELLAAPVLAAPRYADRPIYFSDIVVRRDHPARAFADLRGASWAYNEPQSHSGYGVVNHHLRRLGLDRGFFRNMTASGAHQTSLAWILSGRIDASAIDSSVLETELRRRPALRQAVRVIEVLGPSPVPPWVVSTRLPPRVRRRLRDLLVDMHRDPIGRAVLARAGWRRFAAVTDADYDPIRRMTGRGVPAPRIDGVTVTTAGCRSPSAA